MGADKDLTGINAVHNPTICLPSAGMELVETLGERVVPVAGRREVSMLHLRDPGPEALRLLDGEPRAGVGDGRFQRFHAGDENEPG